MNKDQIRYTANEGNVVRSFMRKSRKDNRRRKARYSPVHHHAKTG